MQQVIDTVWSWISANSFVVELLLSAILIFLVRRKNPTAAEEAVKQQKEINTKLKKELLAQFKKDLTLFCSDKPDDELTASESQRCAAILAYLSARKEVKDEVSES